MHAKTAAAALALVLAAPRVAHARPTVWAVDDGEKIARDAPVASLAEGAGNAIWSPGQPIRLFATKNETIAFQIVVSADEALDGVSVDLEALTAPGGAIRNSTGATDPTSFVGRPIERFVEHFFDVGRSRGRTPHESLGWFAGSGPRGAQWTGAFADALVPVEVAPSWAPYPMTIAAKTNGVVWIDVTASRDQAPGVYTGTIVVKSGAQTIASLPVELTIADVTLPDRPVRTMLYYSREELDRRIDGGDAVERHLWQLYHRHRIAPVHTALSIDDVTRQLDALDGTLFTAEHGYDGPGVAMGDGVLALGTYGTFGEPDGAKLATVECIADALAARTLFDTTDVFVYAIDEQCQSPRGAAWKRLLDGSTNANAKRVRVAWTCDDEPATQPVDIVTTTWFDPARAAAARSAGKEPWVYNGRQPESGSFLTDTPAVGPRVNGWLLGMYDVGRWFYWESTFWYDDNRGGKGAYDPFATAETFHNADGDACMGDGVLVYPGKQVDAFTSHSIGMNGVIASIRLKNWRRGIEDAGYYQLARAANAAKAETIANALLPRVLAGAARGARPSWSEHGAAFFEARRALLDLVAPGTNGGAGAGARPSDGRAIGAGGSGATPAPVRSRSAIFLFVAAAIGIAVALVLVRRRHLKT